VDNPAARAWAPSPALVIAGWLAALVALLLTGFSDDPVGRLFGAVATVVLASAALFGTAARPRLSVDASGIAVRGLLGVRRWPWSRVHRLRVVNHRRLGREIPALELDGIDEDGSEQLVVLGRLDLNAHPEDVLGEVLAVRGLAD